MTSITNKQTESAQDPVLRYIQIIWGARIEIIGATLLCAAAAAVYLLVTPDTYEAQADILVTPLREETVSGLGLIPPTSEPSGQASTAARLIMNQDLANRVRGELELTDSPESILRSVSADPVAESNIVTITAASTDPAEAQRIASAFATGVVAQRTERLHSQVRARIRGLRTQIRGLAGEERAAQAPALYDQIVALRLLLAGPDPTLGVESLAALPRAPVWPRPKLALAAGLLVGLILGIVGAFVRSALDIRELRRLLKSDDEDEPDLDDPDYQFDRTADGEPEFVGVGEQDPRRFAAARRPGPGE